MKSPREVAAARADFLDELEGRLGRFAGGADLSKRYARKLHDWLADRHGGDERFDRVLVVLREYPARIGQAEARAACEEVLGEVRRAVEGERFPWRSVPKAQEPAWRRAFSDATPGVEVPPACPLCSQPSLRRYLRAYEAGRGGGWEWCGTCFGYDHYRTLIPPWWDGERLLDAVPMSVLEHSPEFLERALRLAADNLRQRRRAAAELEWAAAELDACGATRSRDKAERELRSLGHAVHRRTRRGKPDEGGVESLTGRELEVARLVVDRRTNPEIAAELFLSVKTVETHLRNIFRKLDAKSRIEVARTVERAGAR